MNFLSLFSGIGGFDLALERAGMVDDSVVEIDKNCQNILRRHFPNSKLYDDVKKVGIATHERRSIDLICGGFPCQDLSIAGKRAGLAGERSGLWFEFARVIDELEPGWVIIENVPGLLSSNKGKDFAVIIRWLAERRYGVSWRVLDTQYFGVPQRRRRVFIVASFGNGCSSEVLFEPEGLSGDTPQSGKAGEGTTTFSIRRAQAGSNGWGIDTIAHTLDETGGDAVSIAPTLDAQMDRKWGSNQWVDNKFYVLSSGQANAEIVKDGEPSLTGLHEQPIVATSWTLRQGKEGGGKGYLGLENRAMTLGGQEQYIGVRRLTPLECERLQGFPDGWTDGQSDSVRYRQLGNAAAVPVAEWIARRIIKTTEGEPTTP